MSVVYGRELYKQRNESALEYAALGDMQMSIKRLCMRSHCGRRLRRQRKRWKGGKRGTGRDGTGRFFPFNNGYIMLPPCIMHNARDIAIHDAIRARNTDGGGGGGRGEVLCVTCPVYVVKVLGDRIWMQRKQKLRERREWQWGEEREREGGGKRERERERQTSKCSETLFGARVSTLGKTCKIDYSKSSKFIVICRFFFRCRLVLSLCWYQE